MLPVIKSVLHVRKLRNVHEERLSRVVLFSCYRCSSVSWSPVSEKCLKIAEQTASLYRGLGMDGVMVTSLILALVAPIALSKKF